MAFGEEDKDGVILGHPSPDTLKHLRGETSLSPVVRGGHSGAGDCTNLLEGKHDAMPVDEDDEVDGELEEESQTFDDHEDICRRLERTLGLNAMDQDEHSMDDWTELASLIAYHYAAAHMDSSWVKSAGKQKISPSAMLLCLIYMERLNVSNPDFRYRNLMTSSELLVVSLMSACKFLYDVGEVGDCYNGTWARHCKIPIKRLNRMEVDFLNALNWNMQSDAHQFDDMMDKVQTDIVRSNLRFHPTMTYSDLLVLANLRNGFSRQAILESIAAVVKIFATLTASYVLLTVITLSIGAPLAVGLSGRSSALSVTTSTTRAGGKNAPTSPDLPSSPSTCSTLPSSTRVLCNESVQQPLSKTLSPLPRGPYGAGRVSQLPRSPGLSRKFLSSPMMGLPLTREGIHPLVGGRPSLAELHFGVAF